MTKKTTLSEGQRKSQLPALVASLLTLVIAGFVLFFVLLSGGGKGSSTKLDVRSTPEKVTTEIGGYTEENKQIPKEVQTLQGLIDFFSPEGSPIAPSEGSDNPLIGNRSNG